MTTRRTFLLLSFAFFCLAACSTTKKTPYVSDDKEPKELPPLPRYTAIQMALRDELSRDPESDKQTYYLCQSPAQVQALQLDLPMVTLRHASETYTAPVEGWPSVAWCHLIADDKVATRVCIDIVSETPDEIKTQLLIGHQYPNMKMVDNTFVRKGGRWVMKSRKAMEPKI